MRKVCTLASLMILASLAVAADEKPAQEKTGPIKSVDTTAKTFVVTLTARPLTFKWDDKTVFTLDEKPATADALKADAKVTVTYTRSGDDRIATKVAVTSATEKPADKPGEKPAEKKD